MCRSRSGIRAPRTYVPLSVVCCAPQKGHHAHSLAHVRGCMVSLCAVCGTRLALHVPARSESGCQCRMAHVWSLQTCRMTVRKAAWCALWHERI